MKYLAFIWHERGALTRYLGRGSDRLSIVRVSDNLPPSAVILWRGDGDGLRIRSQMFDIRPRFEIGVLTFDVVRPGPIEFSLDVAVTLGPPRKIEKLVIAEDGVTAESGLILEDARGEHILVLAGASPYFLAIRAPGYSGEFQPEYPLDRYQRVPTV